MRKIFTLFIISAVLLSACNTAPDEAPVPDMPSGAADEISENSYIPLNYREQIGLWMPYTQFGDYMAGCSNEEFAENVRDILRSASNRGINTVYFHAHPCGDAYYRSEIYPKGELCGDIDDPLEAVIEEAHSLGISVHAWINPYRLQTVGEMSDLPDELIVKKWIAEENGFVADVGGRFYLNPAYPETTELICRTACEILDNYNVDGIHIDDYFYPTDDPAFDMAAFEKSNAADRDDWRRDNINSMVKALHDTVKEHGQELSFGISPSGNMDTDRNILYADAELWAGTDGYADYIAPQLYYGFENAVCPFEPTLRRWESAAENSDVSLIIGLAEYKVGKYDKWAGVSGENEWIDDPGIIAKQIELVKSSSADGYAFFR